MPLHDEKWYQERATEGILELLGHEHAAVWPEIEAKIAERPHPLLPQHRGVRGIDPHHLVTARGHLLTTNRIALVRDTTRGGSDIGVYRLTGTRRQETAFARAAARKRLLHARYISWTRGAANIPNLVGSGGERVVDASFEAAQAQIPGYLPAKRGNRDVGRLFGVPVPGGTLDNAAHLLTLDAQEMPVMVTVAVEVKNLRDWLFPAAYEVYQLLDKCARLQLAHPARAFLPILVCRQAQYTLFTMAQHLGFLVRAMKKQPLLPHSTLNDRLVAEVRQELGYDVEITDAAHPFIIELFTTTVPRDAARIADRWRLTSSTLAPLYTVLRDSNLPPQNRSARVDDLRERASEIIEPLHKW